MGVFLVVAACGDDEATVRPRLDSGLDTETGPLGDGGGDSGSTCGLTLPSTYDSPSFETNAATELGLRKAFDDFLAPMNNVETSLDSDAGVTPVTKAQLVTLYAPKVKPMTTAYYQAKVDAWLGAYQEALTDGIYTPAEPSAAEKGGNLGKFVFDGQGVDLKSVIEKGTYSAGFYNEALKILSSQITVGTIDRLVAVFGAHPSFQNNPNAQQNKDVNAAAYAARRDSKDAANPGPYQRIKAALIKARASVEAGPRCDADRDAAIDGFLKEWEKSNYATVIFALNDIITKLSVATPDFAAVLHSFGEAIGLIAGFKTLPQEKRIITDAQIDSLLQRVLAADGAPIQAYKLKTSSIEAVSRLQQAIGDIKGVYAFSDSEVEAFKKNN